MTAWTVLLLLLLFQAPQPRTVEKRLPDGRSRDIAILKDDFKKSKKDVAEIIALAQELDEELDENGEFVVDVRSLRKAERIEKLAKSIKNRMKRLQ